MFYRLHYISRNCRTWGWTVVSRQRRERNFSATWMSKQSKHCAKNWIWLNRKQLARPSISAKQAYATFSAPQRRAYGACLEGKVFSEIERSCARVQMNVFLTAGEKWQLQHLSNYFHTERSWAGAPLLGVFVLAFCWCWVQVSHLIHD